VFLLKGYWSDGERRREDQMIAYCDACAEEMTKSWSYPGWMLDWPSRVGSALEWEELPHEAIDMLAHFARPTSGVGTRKTIESSLERRWNG
jgi:hypothetical protein